MGPWQKTSVRKLIFAFALFISGTTGARAQSVWEFGAQRMMVTADVAGPLAEKAFGAAGLLSIDILTSVGGVDLEGVASINPPPDSMAIRYDPANPDGQRLEVTLWGSTYTCPLPDWELKPIAFLADSPYTADTSLFGDGPDPDHYFYIQYHPALKNTLLGLRLLQADVMLMDPDGLSSVPKLDGQTVLGSGEKMPSAADASQAAAWLDGYLSDHPVQSWILTDINTPISLHKTPDGSLIIDSDPYYYLWTTTYYELDQRKQSIESLLSTETNQSQLQELHGELAAVDKDMQDYKASNQAAEPKPLSDATDHLRDHSYMFYLLNPLVWGAVHDTTEYGALFRYYKERDPAGWQTFLSSLQNVTIAPEVTTPTQWKKS